MNHWIIWLFGVIVVTNLLALVVAELSFYTKVSPKIITRKVLLKMVFSAVFAALLILSAATGILVLLFWAMGYSYQLTVQLG